MTTTHHVWKLYIILVKIEFIYLPIQKHTVGIERERETALCRVDLNLKFKGWTRTLKLPDHLGKNKFVIFLFFCDFKLKKYKKVFNPP